MRTALRRLSVALALSLPLAAASKETALDRYVHAPDPSYNYDFVNTIPGEGFKGYVLDLTSQTWTPPIAPDRTVWKHWLTIVAPDEVQLHHRISCTSLADQQRSSARQSRRDDRRYRHDDSIAWSRSCAWSPISRSPFPTGSKPDMVEDEFIAYTWDKFLRTGNDMWPARLPMTKAR